MGVHTARELEAKKKGQRMGSRRKDVGSEQGTVREVEKVLLGFHGLSFKGIGFAEWCLGCGGLLLRPHTLGHF